jgi:hypothetical protein
LIVGEIVTASVGISNEVDNISSATEDATDVVDNNKSVERFFFVVTSSPNLQSKENV